MNKFPQLSRIQMGFSLALLVALFQPLTVAPARADYPDRPIKVIIPFAVGGASDILGRLAAAGVGDALGQRLIVENKAGAGGNLGIAALVEAKADGYTVLFCTSAMTQNPASAKDRDRGDRFSAASGCARRRRPHRCRWHSADRLC